MTAIAKTTRWISPEEYLEAELKSPIRREYVDGFVFPMPESTADHSRITGNLLAELLTQLRTTVCEPFSSTLKLKIHSVRGTAFYYLDVMVVCDSGDDAVYYRERPSTIFEVLSPETEQTDKREKGLAYRQISALQIYVLIEQERMAISIMRRREPGWINEVIEGRNAALRLSNIGVEIPLEKIYERTTALKRALT